eukprot:6005500-Pleurochrysis_carterae.AAC.2
MQVRVPCRSQVRRTVLGVLYLLGRRKAELQQWKQVAPCLKHELLSEMRAFDPTKEMPEVRRVESET